MSHWDDSRYYGTGYRRDGFQTNRDIMITVLISSVLAPIIIGLLFRAIDHHIEKKKRGG